MEKLIVFFRSTIFNLFLYCWTTIYGLMLLPLFIISRKPFNNGKIAKIWSDVILKALKYICKIDYNIQGIIPKEPVVIACKHQSAWETIFFLSFLPNASFVLKKELLYIPVYGWYLSALGMIVINRSGGGRALFTMIKQVKNKLNQSKSVIIFPEGTRVEPTKKVDCNLGIVAIYQSISPQYSVVTVSLNSGKFWGKNSWLKHSGTIEVQIEQQLPFNLSKDSLLATIKNDINALTCK